MAAQPAQEAAGFVLAIPSAAPAEGAAEPHFAAVPGVVGERGPARLDPQRATAGEPERPPPPVRRTMLPFALVGSLALHLLPLAALVDGRAVPANVAPPIPVQLVIVAPKPPPPRVERRPPPPHREQRPPPGRLASEDMGRPEGQHRPASADRVPAAAPREPPPVTELVSALPPPKPGGMPLPLPTEHFVQQAMLPAPRPPPPRHREPPAPPVMRLPGAWPLAPTQRGAPGPAATRDEYLAYCNALIYRHIGMLPASFVAGRRGETALSLLVLDNGTIARISIVRSSGYDDVDERVERMVAAVRRFPPLPQRFQGTATRLVFELSLPDGAVGR